MRSENEGKIPQAVHQKRRARNQQYANLRICMKIHKAKLAELEGQIDTIEQKGNPVAIQKLHLALETEAAYKAVLVDRLSIVGKQYATACEGYNVALAQTHECFGCGHLHKDRADSIKCCMYNYDAQSTQPMPPVSEISKCPDPTRRPA